MSESTVLAINVSKSNPTKQYRIIEGRDGVIYCECMGWKMHRDCRHLRDFHAGTQQMFVAKPAAIRPVTTEESLAAAIENAVNLINKRK